MFDKTYFIFSNEIHSKTYLMGFNLMLIRLKVKNNDLYFFDVKIPNK